MRRFLVRSDDSFNSSNRSNRSMRSLIDLTRRGPVEVVDLLDSDSEGSQRRVLQRRGPVQIVDLVSPTPSVVDLVSEDEEVVEDENIDMESLTESEISYRDARFAFPSLFTGSVLDDPAFHSRIVQSLRDTGHFSVSDAIKNLEAENLSYRTLPTVTLGTYDRSFDLEGYADIGEDDCEGVNLV